MKVLPYILFYFCLATSSLGSANAQSNSLTFEEVYDFNVGDEFHFVEHEWEYTTKHEFFFKQKVLHKKLDTSALEYKLGRYWLNGKADSVTIRIPYADLQKTLPDSGRFIATFWQPAKTKLVRSVQVDTAFGGVETSMLISLDSSMVHKGDSVIVCGPEYRDRFAKGLGQVSYSWSSLGGAGGGTLVYYRKGQQSWGTPLAVKTNVQIQTNIYPNPCSGSNLYVEVNNAHSVRIYDQLGRELYWSEIVNGVLDVSSLPSGTYNLFVLNVEGALIGRMIFVRSAH